MLGFATNAMLPALKGIWSTCFGDSGDYIGFLFAGLLRPENILVAADADGAPEAMLCIEPFELATPAGSARGAYLFGVATLPERQGRGLSTALLEECHRRLAGEGFALSALVPAGESLFQFYGNRGYETAFEVAKADFAAAELPAGRPCRLTPADFGALAALRDERFADRARFVRWDARYLGYIGDECRMLGGETLRIDCMGETGYAVCYRDGDRVTVKELAVPEAVLPDAMAALHARFGAARYRFYLPPDTPGTANKDLPFAMVRWYDKGKRAALESAEGKAPWIAHVLD